MYMQTKAESPVNARGGGQRSYLLLGGGQFGSRNLSITWVDCEPGSEQPLHAHPSEEQVYVIVQGHGVMRCGEETQEVSAGTMVYVPPGTAHAIRNTGDELLVYVSATSPPFATEALSATSAYRRQ